MNNGVAQLKSRQVAKIQGADLGCWPFPTQMMKPPLTFSISTTFSIFHKPLQPLPRQEGKVVSGPDSRFAAGRMVG